MVVKIIHQILFDVGKGDSVKILNDRPEWLKNMNINKTLNPTYRHILWNDKSANEFINEYYPEYKDMISSFPHRFYFIDFFRYLVLSKMGGVYIDMDVCMKLPLPDVDIILGDPPRKDSAIFSNNVIRLSPELNVKLVHYAKSSYERIVNKELYKGRPGRAFLNSVSARMFDRFVKLNNLKSDIDFKEYFIDGDAISWTDKNIGLLNN